MSKSKREPGLLRIIWDAITTPPMMWRDNAILKQPPPPEEYLHTPMSEYEMERALGMRNRKSGSVIPCTLADLDVAYNACKPSLTTPLIWPTLECDIPATDPQGSRDVTPKDSSGIK